MRILSGTPGSHRDMEEEVVDDYDEQEVRLYAVCLCYILKTGLL